MNGNETETVRRRGFPYATRGSETGRCPRCPRTVPAVWWSDGRMRCGECGRELLPTRAATRAAAARRRTRRRTRVEP